MSIWEKLDFLIVIGQNLCRSSFLKKIKGFRVIVSLRNASVSSFTPLYKQGQSERNRNTSIELPYLSLLTLPTLETPNPKSFDLSSIQPKSKHSVCDLLLVSKPIIGALSSLPSFWSQNPVFLPIPTLRNEKSSPSLSRLNPWATTLASPKA